MCIASNIVMANNCKDDLIIKAEKGDIVAQYSLANRLLSIVLLKNIMVKFFTGIKNLRNRDMLMPSSLWLSFI